MSDISALITKKIIENVLYERVKQNNKWGIQKHSNLKWLAILTEEIGEVSENINEQTPVNRKTKYPKHILEDSIKYEIIQVMAVCMAWMEQLNSSG